MATRVLPLLLVLLTQAAPPPARLVCLDYPAACAPPPSFAAPHAFWINLDRSQKRRAHMELMLGLFRIPHTRISAVDYKNFAIRQLPGNKTGPKYEMLGWHNGQRVYTQSLERPDPTGLLSHLQAIRTAYTLGLEHALFLEDDVTLEFFPYWNSSTLLFDLMEVAGPKWQLIQVASWFSSLAKLRPPRLVRREKTHGVWNSGAYLLHRRGMISLLQQLWPEVLQSRSQMPPFPRLPLTGHKPGRPHVADRMLHTCTMPESYIYSRTLFGWTEEKSTLGGTHTQVQNINADLWRTHFRRKNGTILVKEPKSPVPEHPRRHVCTNTNAPMGEKNTKTQIRQLMPFPWCRPLTRYLRNATLAFE